MEITLALWMIPALITLIGLGFVAYISKDDGGFFAVIALGMASPFVALAWGVYAYFK